MDMNSPKTSCQKKFFILKNIKIEGIDAKYDLLTSFAKNKPGLDLKQEPLVTTPELLIQDYKFIDELKNEHQCLAVTSSQSTCTHCWWCRIAQSKPMTITCPIKIQPQFEKTSFYSCAKKTHYDIKEKVWSKNPIIISEGYFCCYGCRMAYIQDQQHNAVYSKSMMLLHQCYFMETGQKLTCTPSPHWRLLKDYGGHLTPQEFHSPWVKYETMGLSSHDMVCTIIKKKTKF